MHHELLLLLAGIGLIALGCQVAAWLLKLPAILFLLLSGIVIGPVLGLLDPNQLFGDLLFPVVSLLVAVVLFEGSLTLRFREIAGLEQVVRRMISVGVAVTWAITAVAAWLLFDFSWQLALLFGAITVVTGPTVVVPMLRTVRPNARIANILRWEGIVIDPIGALLAVLVFELIVSSQGGQGYLHIALVFLKTLGVGLLLGALIGHLFGLLLRHHLLPEYLHNMTALMLVFGAFALADTLQPEAGLLTVTVMGIWLANLPEIDIAEILDFKESLSLVFNSGLFIVLAARLDLASMAELGWPALGLLAVMLLVARPLKVALSTWGSRLSWRERALIAWIAPRGIVAAAVSALFALRLEEHGMAGAEMLVPLTFMVIIGTVVIQSATARPLARWLRVAEPEPNGFLIVGANLVARTIAKGLAQRDYRVLLVDSNWESIQAARMEGMATYYGNPVSEHTDRHLDLVGIGRLLALSPIRELNTLASLRYRGEFGKNRIYTLQSSVDAHLPKEKRLPQLHRGYTLFGEDISYAKLASLINKGAKIHATTLTESFDFAAYQAKYGKLAIPLFAIDGRDRLQAFVANGVMQPKSGWSIIGLIREDENGG